MNNNFFCSTVIATIGRQTLARTVLSVLNQDFTTANFEVIVVNDSGHTLRQEPWHESSKVQLINTNRRKLCVARNTGASIAKGKYLHFLDDDDWLSPNALKYLWETSEKENPEWIYGVTQLVDRLGNKLIKLEQNLIGNCFIQVMAGECIHLQSSIILSEIFFSLGGFNTQITSAEDIDLLRRFALSHDLSYVEKTISCKTMGRSGSTIDWEQYPKDSLYAREQIINNPKVFRRLHDSAKKTATHRNYWYGRIIRLYLTSAYWNIVQNRLFCAMSRLLYSSAGLIISGLHLISKNFWKAITQPYKSFTFSKGFQATEESE